jgi:hypothetical protein
MIIYSGPKLLTFQHFPADRLKPSGPMAAGVQRLEPISDMDVEVLNVETPMIFFMLLH